MKDFWNYLEVVGIVCFTWAAILDINNDRPSDLCRILFTVSILLSLIKIMYLIRVFRNLNFLVTMFITVVNDIQNFMILFSIFVLTFAECFHILMVDDTSYGRTPVLFSYFLMTIRSAMGDFSLIDPY